MTFYIHFVGKNGANAIFGVCVFFFTCRSDTLENFNKQKVKVSYTRTLNQSLDILLWTFYQNIILSYFYLLTSFIRIQER